MKKFLTKTLTLMYILPHFAFAQTSSDTEEVKSILTTERTYTSMNAKLAFSSELFLGRPYLKNGPLGEGPNAEYDQDPLYRTDGFDCTTFVETNIALARSHDMNDFNEQMAQIRYKNGTINFTTRNHFVEVDWNPNNIAAGIIRDITKHAFKKSHTAIAYRIISKRMWYQAMSADSISIGEVTDEVLTERLANLRLEGLQFLDNDSHFPYLKKEFLTDLNIKHAPAVLNIIRSIKDSNDVPTPMVTHQVLLLAVDGKLRIRQASSKSAVMKVTDMSIEEFTQGLQFSTSAIGVNVVKILN